MWLFLDRRAGYQHGAVAPFAGARIETTSGAPVALTELGRSLPSRERGSKRSSTDGVVRTARESLPSRERGSKLEHLAIRCQSTWVAPFAGARIETPIERRWAAAMRRTGRSLRGSADRNISQPRGPAAGTRRSLPSRERGSKQRIGACRTMRPAVAPFAGARIETLDGHRADESAPASLPSRERGSKLSVREPHRLSRRVAPFAGARIETCDQRRRRPRPTASLPSRERGSKHRCGRRRRSISATAGRSLRGSADRNCLAAACTRRIELRVAPFAGARIETRRHCVRDRRRAQVAPFAGARIETGLGVRRRLAGDGRSLRGSADRNGLSTCSCEPMAPCRVAPFAGARIETARMAARRCKPPLVAPFAGARIETCSAACA